MREPPANHLDPKIKNVWRISDGVSISLTFALLAIPVSMCASFIAGSWARLVMAIYLAVYLVFMVIWIFVLPPIRYARWRYELTPEYLDIACGILWRRRTIVPFVRVQNTDTRQGPIMRVFGLASVTVSTAAGAHEIPGLSVEEAERVRDSAAEFARLAREDV